MHPVILDEFDSDREMGELRGVIEVIDGHRGASLEIDPAEDIPSRLRRPTPLLLYDLWDDPYRPRSLHAERPDLVEKYTKRLQQRFSAYRELGESFARAEVSPLTPDQLRTLRALVYVQ